ncbi:MAG: protein kinase, partial [Chloroflexota bacterium]|nr:protein kinase [Chloroflexota bacterium]
MNSLIGQNLGQYRIIEQLGKGGMATVYKAYQPSLDRYVAIKVLPPYFAHETGFAERFTREARAVARLEHHHILPIHDFGQEGDLSYIVMKYVEAGTLKEMLGQPMAPRRAADVISQIAEALD